jgi:hypothetical protein|nr:MAG TPA: protein of unknown function (UPF0180) [Caudoviricetes sp.]
MSVTDWKMQEEWKSEIKQNEFEEKDKLRRVQKSEYYDSLQNNQPLTPISTLKELKSKQYDEALRKIDLYIKDNFMKENKVGIYQDLLPDNVRIDDKALHERIKKQGYELKINYGLMGEVDCLVVSGW